MFSQLYGISIKLTKDIIKIKFVFRLLDLILYYPFSIFL